MRMRMHVCLGGCPCLADPGWEGRGSTAFAIVAVVVLGVAGCYGMDVPSMSEYVGKWVEGDIGGTWLVIDYLGDGREVTR